MTDWRSDRWHGLCRLEPKLGCNPDALSSGVQIRRVEPTSKPGVPARGRRESQTVRHTALWELGTDDVCHVTPTHISSDDPSPNVTKCGGALRRMGSSCASLGL